MSHKCIRLLIEHTAKSLGDDIDYTYARTSDFNLIRDKTYPFITLDTLRSVPQYTVDGTLNYMKSWGCSMAFYQIDKKGSTEEEYAPILDQMDDLVDKFINRLNFYSTKSDEIVIENINQEPFVKATADYLTGFYVTFNILAADTFDYCTVTNEC